jgi:D-tyrosyl-tRNA(Tyr) deacylase
MKIVYQRVRSAEVEINNLETRKISKGLVLLLAFTHEENDSALDYFIDKTLNLRIFDDENGKMNLSLLDIQGEILLVSQFTLYGDASKGRRPSFINAAKPESAKILYDLFVEKLKNAYPKLVTGEFAADMLLTIRNDGPVTIICEK